MTTGSLWTAEPQQRDKEPCKSPMRGITATPSVCHLLQTFPPLFQLAACLLSLNKDSNLPPEDKWNDLQVTGSAAAVLIAVRRVLVHSLQLTCTLLGLSVCSSSRVDCPLFQFLNDSAHTHLPPLSLPHLTHETDDGWGGVEGQLEHRGLFVWNLFHMVSFRLAY